MKPSICTSPERLACQDTVKVLAFFLTFKQAGVDLSLESELLRTLKQEDHQLKEGLARFQSEFKDNLGNLARPHLKIKAFLRFIFLC